MYSESDDVILERMKEKITDVDTSEGSFVHDALAPTAIELADSKLQLDELLNKVFTSKAFENGYSEYLDLRCADYGLSRKEGTKATGKITFTGAKDTIIETGTIVQTESGLRFITTESGTIGDSGSIELPIESESTGSKYNLLANTITQLPIQLIGITGVNNADKTVGGTDTESDEDLYNRLLLKIRTPSTSGNIYDYQQWCLSVTGVGAVKVFPLKNGNGTVECCICDSNKKAASTELINSVKNYVETVRPIGATVTVVSATEKTISVSTTLVHNSTKTLETLKQDITDKVTDYFKSIAFKETHVSIAKINSLIFSITGVTDITSLTLNGSTSSIDLSDTEIPVLSEVTISE